MNKTEKQVIENVIRRLRGEQASPQVRESLTDSHTSLYLESWVIPALERLIREDRNRQDLQIAKDLSGK